jgi:glycerol-3-phosphate cytidylyltransferase
MAESMRSPFKYTSSTKLIGFTCGSFDLLHTGHILMLREAKEQCDVLIVGLQTDPTIDRKEKAKPVQSIFERWTQLEAIKYIDKIIPYDSEASLLELLNSIPIDLRIIGEDYKTREFTGKGLHEIHYNDRKHTFSSTELKERLRDNNGR